jgi:SAM-dependent methyltransferase
VINQLWPPPLKPHWTDKVAVKLRKFPGFCVVCTRPTMFLVGRQNLRESVACGSCGSSSRHRQLLIVLLQRWGLNRPGASLKTLAGDVRVWNLEAKCALHDNLQKHLGSNYVGSEYIDPALRSGDVRNGMLHVDVEDAHFPDGSFDVILSSDVLEHVAAPTRAVRETHRVLRPGGMHVFTVPFYAHRFLSERRAFRDERGDVQHLMPPMYHADPMRPEVGALVYNIFAPEFLCELESMGFDVTFYVLHEPFRGILGNDALVFVAQKR